MVFQRDALLEWRDVRRNILLPVEFAHKPAAAYADKVSALLALTGLESSPAATRANCPAACVSGSRSAGPWWTIPGCC